MEINLQFDDQGRTRCTLDEGGEIDYFPKTVMTSLNDLAERQLDGLLFDCEIADCDIMPRTFWMPVDGSEPKCALEKMALDVFQFHVDGSGYDKATSGAEWWVQIRPAPSPDMDDKAANDKDNDMSTAGISFHWDKDEDLRELAGGNLYVHPHISTVTYLTSIGAPTVVCNHRIHALTGEWIESEESDGYLSWPKRGKHLSFDGGYLHAAPPNLMKEGQFKMQCQIPPTDDETHRKSLVRRHQRVTFLVNAWLNYKPVNVDRFPESMVDKLSKSTESWKLFESPSTLPVSVIELDKESTSTTTRFTWPMGGCGSNESISAPIPLDKVREKALDGPNIRLKWSKDAAVVLSKSEADDGAKQEVTEDNDNQEPDNKKIRPS